MGVGALLIFIGVALFSAPAGPPAHRILSAGRLRSSAAPPGTLARDNARRNPQRTASTAAALMIGLALVTLVATLAAGITSTFRGAVNELFTSDYAITAQNNFSPIPTDAAEAAAKAPGSRRSRARAPARRASSTARSSSPPSTRTRTRC